MASNPTPLDPAEVDTINAQASALMKRGIQLLNEGKHDAAAQALVYFDRALEMRLALPYQAVPLLAYGLAACWLNKADALARLGGPADLVAALTAYGEGIAVMRHLPMAADPRFPRRLAIAHQNRGLALQAQGAARTMEAIAAFDEAMAVLDREESQAIPDRPYLLAATCVNLASAQASLETTESSAAAHRAALRALSLVADLEGRDADAADVGLKARHVLCRTVAARLAEAPTQGEAMPDDVHAATDAVDDGLGLVRRWEQQGVERFRGIAYDLFRFGARVYARYQPQFLEEFVQENMDATRSSPGYVDSEDMRAAADEALRLRASRARDV